jgi:hypothetical protein
MNKKSSHSRLINILTLFVLCLLLSLPALSQQENNSQKTESGSYEEFEAAEKMPCGERSKAVRIGKKIVEDYEYFPQLQAFIDSMKKRIAVIERADALCKETDSLETLFENFKKAKKAAGCDDLVVAVSIGKRIIENFGDNKLNQTVIEYLKKQIPIHEEQVRICERNDRYNYTYKTKSWNQFFAVSKQIIEEEGDKPLALDVMLTLVSVGFDRTAYENDNFYNSDTIYYAQKAIDLIENGTNSGRCWGVFECYESKDKALGWLNYIIGYISYFRLKENKKAIPYFYKSTQYKMEFKYDAFVYQAVAIHYFDKESITASKARNIANPADEDSNNLTNDTAKTNEIIALYKNLVNLYNLRYNLEETENPADLANYIQLLINKPLIDTSANNKQKPDTRRTHKTQ